MVTDFVLRGLSGHVDVEFGVNEEPETVGAWPGAAGLPFCQATVSYPAGRGYLGWMGWIQLVRSTDNLSRGERFEMDPLEILGTVGHPFCYFGITPTLFDAPARDDRHDLDWVAHSFLTYVADRQRREVRALLGFSWGFHFADSQVSLAFPAWLDADDWNKHIPVLAAAHPGWAFAEGVDE